MLATVKMIAGYMEELAPLDLALPGDPSGLQLGDPEAPVAKVLVALDPDEAALRQALAVGASLVVTHHPLLFHPAASIDESRPRGALISAFIRNRISVYSAHTNLDTAPRGLNHALAELIGLSPSGRSVLKASGQDRYLKLVVFVPRGHEDSVRDALAEAGAGWIGNYSHCTFQAPGTGTFMPREGTNPYIGQQGRLEKVEELRLETILPASRRQAVIKALLAAHPYEEVAYDIYPLAGAGEAVGLGLCGQLEPPLELEAILARCRERLKLKDLRYWASAKDRFSRIAVCGGSGGSLVEAAIAMGAELYISGDFRYHDFKTAQAAGMGLIDAGHYGTEQPAVALIENHLRNCLQRDGRETVVIAAAAAAEADWNYLEG
ncbi:MAG: Nif3-like dinuclear metal center hexameric protein [Firmicutes bacterium]|jgi:dinuclear metal center YbgI/SA1388 family protein|nr:Nif3-like dinuclear metal center hexameric protein [Bacillota bacterium]